MAVGRSGRRVERSLKTSGLLGEQLNDGEEPSKNSFVQRSWLPTAEDPALVYRKQGASPTSPEVGGTVSGRGGAYKSSFGRKSLVLFNPVAKVGVQIFADDPVASNC